ncbi:TolC family protein [Vibrio sp. DW001]|uniref:TolC family protein n=1 Tax=Vibrio sp. DW001 TaxID=2912315 RepID=UPI0023B09603|nr:TolC family protein [Vibrio sp. DW001]WED27554.1 TolC family protein [Vibrio sp. DW001]
MKTKIKISITTMLCVISLFGCSSMRTEYQQPEIDTPESWPQERVLDANVQSSEQESGTIERPDRWWTLFEDSQLNSLIDQVLKSNSDLEKATLTLRKARMEAGISENNKVPTISYSQDSSYEYDTGSGTSDTNFDSKLSLSYELDLWGRVNAVVDADEWSARASYEDRENMAQNLVVTTATLYWKVGYLNQMLALTKQNITGTERVATLTKYKYNIGSATRLEVLESTQTLFNQQVQLNQLQQELSETLNAMSTLLNQPLQDTGITIEQLSVQPVPDIEPGIPSDLLLRRPDVQATLYALKSSLANKDAIDASYMPTFELTSSLSTSSSNLLELLQNPVAKLGSGIVLPFLEWHEMELNKSISELDYQMAVVDYRSTIYQAFEEVANLLTAKERYYYQGNIYKEKYVNAKEIERIYASKYENGASDIIDWINAMESRRSIESSLLENRYNQFVTQVNLYKSLGGGDIAPEA